MSDIDSLTGKTVSSTRKDLLHMNNDNVGLDSSLRSIYGGNGEESPLSLSTTQVAANCGEGTINRPQIKNSCWTWLDHSSISGTNYTVSLLGGNYHKITLSGILTNLVIGDVAGASDENLVADVTLVIDAQNTYSITNWPVTTLWPSGVKPDFATQANNGHIVVRLFTLDGGTTWYGQILGDNLRSAP